MISLLAASEKEIGQTESALETKLEMWWDIMTKCLSWSELESSALEGDSPVDEEYMSVLKRVGRCGLVVWIRQN